MALPWNSRQHRRILKKNKCSFCQKEFEHNKRTFLGYVGDTAKVACEGCLGQLSSVTAMGLYTERKYDFFDKKSQKGGSKQSYTVEEVTDVVSALQKTISATDEMAQDAQRAGGLPKTLEVSVLEHPWKDDDRAWFEQHPDCSHRARAPYPGEADKQRNNAPDQCELIILVRQIEPGKRIKTAIYIYKRLLPVPDYEPLVHALFDTAVESMKTGKTGPINKAKLFSLIERYKSPAVS